MKPLKGMWGWVWQDSWEEAKKSQIHHLERSLVALTRCREGRTGKVKLEAGKPSRKQWSSQLELGTDWMWL